MKIKASQPTTALAIRQVDAVPRYERTSFGFDENKPFKVRLRSLARMNGRAGKQKAAKLALILKVQTTVQSSELTNEAAHLAKTVSYHLRQATIIGRHIEKIEKRERLSAYGKFQFERRKTSNSP